LLSAALFFLLQVGPNPSTGSMPGLPPEILDWRAMEKQREGANVTLVNRLGNCLARAEEDTAAALAEAGDWLTKANGIEQAQALHCRGYSEARLTRWRDAATSFQAARNAVGEMDVKYRARLGTIAGSALITAGDYNGALEMLDLAAADAAIAEFTALGGEIQIDRARALLSLEQSGEAAAALTNARRLSPLSARAWLLSATLARRSDDLGNAAEYIAQAGRLDAANPEVLLEAGVIAVMSGDNDLAREKWGWIVSGYPDAAQRATAESYLRQLDQQ